MKMTSTLLTDFIQDFNLEVSEAGVCFDALIDFNISGQKFDFQSEVLLESPLFTCIDTLYILNPVTRIYMMPTLFNDVNHQFIYFKNRGLFIVGCMSLLGAYSISIFPEGSDCGQDTLDELRAKKLN